MDDGGIMSDIINDDGCVELVAAVINPKSHAQPGGRRASKEKKLPPIGDEWLSLAAGILDIDQDVVMKHMEEVNAKD